MINLQWDSKYEIGHQRIDSEHKIFLGLIAETSSEIETACNVERIRRLQNELTKYAAFHFVSEENIMEETGYPDFAEHRKMHLQLLSTLDDCSHRLHSGVLDYQAYVAFLFEWFAMHTSNEDKKIARFLANRATVPAGV